ncbi:DUF2610 domain-containing protein [Ktedonospora formicarum]|uniref:DUF2610 domain-containing protein n=1 Tax=Ktedonospora formicarum TaxID=2778364 RepID=A0A8J3HXM5_9CHLR|nr:DUF2610 domain-containing protein [Ktedonospora formicarum]GHO46067.1 hypothetical protein KSX_42300 [Ktedonospora formicarum]
MKKFTIPCDFGRERRLIDIYIGSPGAKAHPLEYQAKWLSSIGGTISSEIMDSFQKLHAIALENGVSFEELCVYALGTTSDNVPGEAQKDEQ